MTYINETGVDVIRSVNSKNEWQLHSRSFNWKKQYNLKKILQKKFNLKNAHLPGKMSFRLFLPTLQVFFPAHLCFSGCLVRLISCKGINNIELSVQRRLQDSCG
jgi:hypothetical protein